MKTIEEIKERFVEAKADAKEQLLDGLISKKEMKELFALASDDMARAKKRLKKIEK